MLKKLTKPLNLLIALLIVIVVSSLAAGLVQNSFFSVKVSTVKFETERGELSGMLYMPKGVDATNPAPAIVLTHGYLNNKEMQEVGAIEMSRRGFVVLAFDMYDHGDSVPNAPNASFLGPFGFYIYSVYDAAKWMYSQDYVLKDAAGNGMIAVSGHSMGGFSSEYALVWDEINSETTGYRMITAALPVGADFRYIFPMDAFMPPTYNVAQPWSMFGNRSVGVIAAQYDQFFFDNVPGAPGSMVHKDYTADPVGLAFLGRTAQGEALAGSFYSVAGGQRVIYTPDETHPQDTWSLESGRDMIDFFTRAFTYQLNLHSLGTLDDYGINTVKTGQVWWLKEAFTLIALLALIALIFPAFMLLTKLPVFKKVYPEGEVVAEAPKKSPLNMVIFNYVVLFATFLSMFLIKPFMDRGPDWVFNGLGTALLVVLIAAAVGILATWVLFFVKKNDNLKKVSLTVTLYGAAVVIVSLAFYLFLKNRADVIQQSTYFNAPSVNTIVYWAMCAGGLILVINLLAGLYFNFKGETKNPFGLKASPVQIGASILTALALVVGILFVVALVGWIFLTDFRIYTYAIQIFNSRQFVAGLRYIPFFFVYYFAAGLAVFANTRSFKRGWVADIFAAFLLAGPVVLFLIYQYIPLYNNGVAEWPTFSLSSILCVGLIPTLTFAAIILRRFSLKTGNIWTGVVFVTVFFTLITLANTAVYTLA